MKKRLMCDAANEASTKEAQHTTILYLHFCQDCIFPVAFVYDGQLSADQINVLKNSSPDSRADSEVSLPSFDGNVFDETVWKPIDLDNDAGIDTSTPTTVIHAWMDQ